MAWHDTLGAKEESLAQHYDFISSDTHLEVLPERWTGRVPARYRDKMPRTVPHPDGGDAIQIEGAPLFQVAYLDLRAGRTSEDWKPFDVRVEETAVVGSAEQRLREQDQDSCAAEVLFPNMQAGPGLFPEPAHFLCGDTLRLGAVLDGRGRLLV